MGIEYRHYLMPVSRPFRPSPKQVVELISIFRAARWIATPDAASFKKVKFETTAENEHAGESGAFAKTKKGIRPLEPNPAPDLLADLMEDDAILEWPVEHIGRADLEYPFEVAVVDPETYYDLQLHFAPEYVHHDSEVIHPLESVKCCGETLEFHPPGKDIFYASRIRVTCPRCKRPFDPSKMSVATRNPWTGAPAASLLGGLAYRFAIVIDCGKALPSFEGPVPLREKFKQTCEKALGEKLVDIGDIY